MNDDDYETGYKDGENSGHADWILAISEDLDLDVETPAELVNYVNALRSHLPIWTQAQHMANFGQKPVAIYPTYFKDPAFFLFWVEDVHDDMWDRVLAVVRPKLASRQGSDAPVPATTQGAGAPAAEES